VTPEDLRARAVALDADAEAAVARGDTDAAAVAAHQAELWRITARKLESLMDSRSPDVQDKAMTQDQLARRGRAVALTAAHNELLSAIANDPRWGSARAYCKNSLRIAPSSLTGYMNGTTPCPRWLADRVRADFPKLSWTWPAGVVD